MHDTATRAAEALDDLAAELHHADVLITEQQTRIEVLERQVRLLQVLLDAGERPREGPQPAPHSAFRRKRRRGTRGPPAGALSRRPQR